MTTRSDEPAPNEQRERVEEAKLGALKRAASQGWADITAGRYVDVEDDQLAIFIGQLGRTDRAVQGCREPKHETVDGVARLLRDG